MYYISNVVAIEYIDTEIHDRILIKLHIWISSGSKFVVYDGDLAKLSLWNDVNLFAK